MTTDDAPQVPSSEDSIAAIHELIDAWETPRPNSRLAAWTHEAYGPVLFAHVAHAHRLAEGVLTLHAAGQGLVAMPLVRQIIECTMRAVWLTVYHENLPALVQDGERQRRNALDAAAARGLIPADSDALKASQDWLAENIDAKAATSGKYFEALCDELVGGDTVYAHYRIASNFTHPGSMLQEQYLEQQSDGAIVFVTSPEMPAEQGWLNTTAYMLVLAAVAWDRVDQARVHRKLVRRLAKMYGVPTEFTMTDKGFVNWNRAEKERKRRARTKKGGTGKIARSKS